jgi:DNA-binding CsgD family transcriptional regulator
VTALSHRPLNRYAKPTVALPKLTYRKLSVVLHLAAGRDYGEIAHVLKIHPNTVRAHIARIAEALPEHPDLPPRDKVLLWCDRLLSANTE